MTKMNQKNTMVKFSDMQKILAQNSFAVSIGMELLDVEDGCARARVRLQPQLENVYGAMHGGCAFTIADTLAGIAASTCGDRVTTLDASINYMSPVMHTEYLYCTANVRRSGVKISVVRTELTDDDGRLLIDGSFTYYHM